VRRERNERRIVTLPRPLHHVPFHLKVKDGPFAAEARVRCEDTRTHVVRPESHQRPQHEQRRQSKSAGAPSPRREENGYGQIGEKRP
jgi:hypothetical protein